MKLILNELQDIPVNASISLYGAGEIGISLFRMLQEHRPDVEIRCFVDTYKKGNLYGIKIIHPDELDNEKTKFDFIVIASHTYQDHIQAILEQKGIKNYRFLNPIFNVETLYGFYDRAVSPDGINVIMDAAIEQKFYEYCLSNNMSYFGKVMYALQGDKKGAFCAVMIWNYSFPSLMRSMPRSTNKWITLPTRKQKCIIILGFHYLYTIFLEKFQFGKAFGPCAKKTDIGKKLNCQSRLLSM